MKVKNEAELEAFWDAYSDSFEKRAVPFTKLVIQQMLLLCPLPSLKKDDIILDLACGSGPATELLLPSITPPIRYFGVDLSANMLQMARTKADRLQHPHQVEWVKGSVANIDCVGGDSVRLIFASFILHLVPDPLAMLRENLRVLQPGASAVYSIWGRKEFSPYFTLFAQALQEAGVPNGAGEERSKFHISCEEGLRDLARQAGFSSAHTCHIQTPLPGTNAREVISNITRNHLTVGKVLESVGPEKADEIMENMVSILHNRYYANNLLPTSETILLLVTK